MTGEEYLSYNKKKAREYPLLLAQGFANRIEVNEKAVDHFHVLSMPNKHVFAGYYDLCNVSEDGKLFFLAVGRGASPRRSKAELYLFDIHTQEITKLTSTRAWNWQQGCRASWIDRDRLLYNDYADGYLCREIDIHSRTITTFSNCPLYDFSLKSGYGASINFERTQVLRPGYGYERGKKKSLELAPSDDGVFLIHLGSQETELICSLSMLKSEVIDNCTEQDYHYINHVKFSPSGEKIMFFHLWAKDGLDMWKVRMMLYDIPGHRLSVLEDKAIVSHYAWMDDHRLLVTHVTNETPCYFIYDIDTKTKVAIQSAHLAHDGHPVFFANPHYFISDTYPLEHSMQKLFVYHCETGTVTELMSAFSDPRLFIEKRCDLHPKFSEKHNLINLDSTFSDGLRKIIILKNDEKPFNG